MGQLADALFTVTQQNVLGLLYVQPDKSFYTKEIIRLTGMGVATIKRELDRMEAAGILRMTKIGNQHHYQANPECPIYEELSRMLAKLTGQVMKESKGGPTKMSELVEQYRGQILSLAKENGVRNVRVFGSMARNEAGPDSDLDLLVDIENGKSGLALGGFLIDVSELVHRKVDVVTEKSLHPTIRKKVLHEARAL